MPPPSMDGSRLREPAQLSASGIWGEICLYHGLLSEYLGSIGSISQRVIKGFGNLGMSTLPLRFLTPFPRLFSRRCGTPRVRLAPQILSYCYSSRFLLNDACSEQSSRPPERLPSKNASERLNLRGRFSIPKLPITHMEMLTARYGFLLIRESVKYSFFLDKDL
jgi:hypothetical protein